MPLRQRALPAHDARAEAVSPAALSQHWDAEALRQRLLPLLAGLSVEVLAQCESTNTLLIERARSGDGALVPCMLVAEQQTRGRGRLGRTWVSAAGASLTFSLALPLAPRDWSGLSLAVGLALAEALDPAPAGEAGGAPSRPAPRIVLKWPNDLWLADATQAEGVGRKLGGVLVETLSAGTQRLCIVGVGLNVLPLPPASRTADAAGMASGYGCLQQVLPGAHPPQVLAVIAAPLVRALLAFEQDGFAPLAAAYGARDLLRGRAVTTSLPEWAAGVAEGVDESGALMLHAGGRRHRIVSGEVSVQPAERVAERPAPQGTASAGSA